MEGLGGSTLLDWHGDSAYWQSILAYLAGNSCWVCSYQPVLQRSDGGFECLAPYNRCRDLPFFLVHDAMTDELPVSDFVVEPPAYILASHFNTDPETGKVLFDKDILVVSPDLPLYGGKCVAIFTDLNNAETFREESPTPNLGLVHLADNEALLEFLVFARQFSRTVIFDPYHEAHRQRQILYQPQTEAIDDLIASLDRQ